MSAADYQIGLRASLTQYPTLTEAVEQYRDDAALRQITRLVGCGWTLPHLERLIGEHVGDGRRPSDVLATVHLYAHVGPDHLDTWIATHGGRLEALDDIETLRAVDVALAMEAASTRTVRFLAG